MKRILPLLLLTAAALPAQRARIVDREALSWIDYQVERAIATGRCPGAVVMAGNRTETLYFKAYGDQAVLPRRVSMPRYGLFDLASVTKPVATGLSVLTLWERGRFKLDDPVSRHLPEFTGKGKEKVTIRQLLLHQGGLTPDNPLRDYRDGPAKAWERICALPLIYRPGTRFRYTDVGFIVLGKLVEKISGLSLDEYAKKNIFEPLGMRETGFNPGARQRPVCVPTQVVGGEPLQGTVHDPRARLMGGVAGHAGLFSTAPDLARLCQALLNGGSLYGRRILKASTVKAMATLAPDGSSRGRGLGWDLTSGYSSPRGHWLTRGVSYGHSGFTGTSLWIDPATGTWLVFLSSRCHPHGKGNVLALRRRVGSSFGRALGLDRRGTRPGVEVLEHNRFAALKGRKVGLITNHTGRTRDGRSTIDLLHRAPGVQLKALFSPEHGIRGVEEKHVAHDRDRATGLRIWSLYGRTRKPTAAMLEGLDTLVFDIQDIGCRFYTYISTMRLAMEAAAEHGLRFVVLDRINPIGGHRCWGPFPDRDMESFVACAQLPLVHGMTVGELARLFNTRERIGCRLEVITVAGWRRHQWQDDTDAPWVHPSPNMRSLRAATLYPGVGLIEATNTSVGRGTPTPFELFGAPWLDGEKLAHSLTLADTPGLTFKPVTFTPRKSKHVGEKCRGVAITITDRERVRPVRLGLLIIRLLHAQHPGVFKIAKVNRLLRNKELQALLEKGKGWRELEPLWDEALRRFWKGRKRVLLYR